MIAARCDFGDCRADAVVLAFAYVAGDPAGTARDMRPACRRHTVDMVRPWHVTGASALVLDIALCDVAAVSIRSDGIGYAPTYRVTIRARCASPVALLTADVFGRYGEPPEYVARFVDERTAG